MAGRGSLAGLLAYGNFRANLEETGMGYALEVDMIRLAHEKNMLTTPYVFSAEGAQYIMEHCPQCDGFYGASSMERLPTEIALTDTTKQFKSITR